MKNLCNSDVLVHRIESGLHKRAGAAVTNFERTLPSSQSDLAQQITKDPYTFDFLMLAEDAHERELEQGLLAHLRDFLLELGIGFAFVARQYRLEVGGSDFAIFSSITTLLCHRGFEGEGIRAGVCLAR